jgi:hypothetical protein
MTFASCSLTPKVRSSFPFQIVFVTSNFSFSAYGTNLESHTGLLEDKKRAERALLETRGTLQGNARNGATTRFQNNL